MNTEYFSYCIKSVKRRWKTVIKTSFAIFLVFVAVAWIMLVRCNMYQWQVQSAKNRFGDWFVMSYGSDSKENDGLKGHPYLDESGKAVIVNNAYDSNGDITDIRLGYMLDDFIRIGNISLDEGSFPQKDDEIAVDWNTLLKLNQGNELGQNIVINVVTTDEKGQSQSSNKTYKLAGILKNYSNVWVGGSRVPDVIVTESEADSIKRSTSAIYIYTVSDYVQDSYSDIYDGLKKKAGSSLIYNSSVYEYEPWSGSSIYNYMYLVIMLVGVAGISYELMVYSRGRKNVYIALRRLGAGRLQLVVMAAVEGIAVVICSSFIGLIFSMITGRLAGLIIERKTGIGFYTVDKSVYMGLIFMLVIAIILVLIMSFTSYGICYKEICECHKAYSRRKRPIRHVDRKHILNRKNYIYQTSARLINSQGRVHNVVIRVFALAIMVIVVLCSVNSINALKEYNNNADKTDVIGFKQQDKNTPYVVNIAYDYNKYEELFNRDLLNSPDASQRRRNIDARYASVINNPVFDMYKNTLVTSVSSEEPVVRPIFNNYMFNYKIKRADASMYKGIDDVVIDYLSNINGVSDISYGYYETARVWTWNNMDYNKLGAAWYEEAGNAKNGLSVNSDSDFSSKYLFSTEYVKADSRVYDILSSYVEDFDYSEFCKGNESVLFLDKNPYGEYDDTITKGSDIGLMGYQSYVQLAGSQVLNMVYSTYYKAVYNYMNEHNMLDGVGYYIKQYNSKNGIADTGDIDAKTYNYFYNRRNEYTFNITYVPVATTKIAKVIYVDDDIKEKLKEYIPEFGVYTMLASDALGEKAVNKQNELLKEYFMLDDLPQELTLSMKYNQINVRYGLESVYNGTANAVASYLGQAGFSYSSYSDSKEQIKKDTVAMIVMNVFTAIIAMLMYICVNIHVLNNRIEKYNDRMRVLKSTGANKSTIIKMHMLQCVRESLWCIILMPFVLILDILFIKRGLRDI